MIPTYDTIKAQFNRIEQDLAVYAAQRGEIIGTEPVANMLKATQEVVMASLSMSEVPFSSQNCVETFNRLTKYGKKKQARAFRASLPGKVQLEMEMIERGIFSDGNKTQDGHLS
jgi:hypothetical protein